MKRKPTQDWCFKCPGLAKDCGGHRRNWMEATPMKRKPTDKKRPTRFRWHCFACGQSGRGINPDHDCERKSKKAGG